MWIEIPLPRWDHQKSAVILRVKDVDWNRVWIWAEQGRRKSSFVWRMWIEIVGQAVDFTAYPSSFVWRMWIEIRWYRAVSERARSSFVWRMWIEIHSALWTYKKQQVILRVKDVDWNTYRWCRIGTAHSHPSCEGCGLKSVAKDMLDLGPSHPSCEGCGLKFQKNYKAELLKLSSFVWRMWIEIRVGGGTPISRVVILRVKDVDWNGTVVLLALADICHPSCEGCGLK